MAGGLAKGTYDLEITVGVDAGVKEKLPGIVGEYGKDRITMSPQVTNITRDASGEVDFSMRNFYNGKCNDEKDCTEIMVSNLEIMNTYPAKFILIINDQRAATTSAYGSWNMDPIRVHVKVYRAESEKAWKPSTDHGKSERLV